MIWGLEFRRVLFRAARPPRRHPSPGGAAAGAPRRGPHHHARWRPAPPPPPPRNDSVVSTALFFIGSIVLIVSGAELFTNAIEWAGSRMQLDHGAYGSLLASLRAALTQVHLHID